MLTPERFAAKRPFLIRRALLARAIRAFFSARGYLEIETPYAVPTPGEEEHLRAFATTRHLPNGAQQSLWLHTSPEFAMKRLLAAGAGKIFQLARVWRNHEHGRLHAAEFTMLEWYRPGATLDDLMDETEDLLKSLLPPELPHRAGTLSIAAPFQRLTLQDAFQRFTGANLLATAGNAQALADAADTHLRPNETWEDLFFRLLLDRIEPEIGHASPAFLTHWPAAQAALARRAPNDPRVAERFELFAGGMELANAFIELTDAAEQRARFEAARAARHAATGTQDWPLDEDLLAALANGLPPSGGVALGFDRLVMLATGTRRIDDVQALPVPPPPLYKA